MIPASTQPSQRGSVFVYILIGVFLFAALGYAISDSMRGNSGVTTERTKLAASEIIATGNLFAEAVTRLRLKGVAKNAISFDNVVYPVYFNSNCTNNQCLVFHPDGGGLSWETAPQNITEIPWVFSGTISVQDVGTPAGDLAAYLSMIPADVCKEINVLLGIMSPAETVPYISGTISAVAFFTGTYGSSLLAQPRLNGKKSGCTQLQAITGSVFGGGTLNEGYYYYQVLVAN